MPEPMKKICAEPGCCDQVYRKKDKCRKHYQKEYRKSVNYKPDHSGRNQVKVTDGKVFIDGLEYKMGLHGRPYYLLGREWKLSSRDPKWVAAQIQKAGG